MSMSDLLFAGRFEISIATSSGLCSPIGLSQVSGRKAYPRPYPHSKSPMQKKRKEEKTNTTTRETNHQRGQPQQDKPQKGALINLTIKNLGSPNTGQLLCSGFRMWTISPAPYLDQLHRRFA